MNREPHDTRLVAPALVAWLVAALAVGGGRWQVAVGGGCLLAVAVGLWRGLRRPRARRGARWPRPMAALVLSGVVGLAVLASVLAAARLREDPAVLAALRDGGSSQVVLRIDGLARPITASGAGRRYIVAATLVQIGTPPGRARVPVAVMAGPAWSGLVPGSVVETAARLRGTQPGERAVALVLPSEVPSTVRPPPRWQQWTDRFRVGLRSAVEGMPPHAAGLIPGVALGDESRVPPSLVTAMRVSALGHLLAVSGAHVAVILGLLQLLTLRAPVVLRLLVAGGAVLGLVVLVGPEPSVVRAAAMAAVALLALVLGRPSAAIPALATAVVVLVLVDPWIAREAGFELSVLATAGIVWWSTPWSEALAERMGRLAFLAPMIALPAAAQVACLPVLLTLDAGLAPYGVIANALVAPVIPAHTVLSLGATVLAPWVPGVAGALVWAAQPATWWIERVATWFAGAPLARLPWPGPPGGVVLAAAVAVLAWLLVRTDTARGRLAGGLRRLGRAAPVLVLSASAVVTAAALIPGSRSGVVEIASSVLGPRLPPDWRVVVCDVGQGTAVLISTAAGGGGPAAVMVDAGGPDGLAVACLRRAGVTRIEVLALTHADLDHVGGIEEVSGAVVLDRVVVPVTGDERMDDVVARLRGEGIGVVALTSGDAPIDAGELSLRPVWPSTRAVELAVGSGDADRVVNDLSLTLWVSAPDLTVLVNGDLGGAAQAALARSLGTPIARPDVLVVAHHGSGDQDAGLLAATAGAVSVISVGAGNDYGHPAQRTLDLLAGTGTLLRRTDLCGDIALRRREGVLEVTRCG